ncbi:hypothetical protein LVD15_01255 [Fulvivirga maritima]|uniref:hypothetical protein n=1 Tax=Fulvivirga maritima TaxID=2904247 RepID=UPI001F24D14F|nr:hypothetical protein [Fulvivirga maritima]UII27080.1 hypothetical protein LVD15_01255 [Fulvivirga maritima]
MKNIIYILSLTLLLISCVDDYTDANPPLRLDGPAPFISYVGDEIIATDTDDDTYTFVPNGGTARIEVRVVDSPGLIDSVSVAFSNIQIPTNWGSYSVEGLEAVRGQSTGSFVVVYHAPTLDENSAFLIAEEEIVITVYDAQEEPKSADISTVPTLKTQFSIGSDCFSSENLIGFYSTISNGYDAINDENYSNLEDTVEVYILPNGINSPGYYRLSDGSFGLYPSRESANNFINFDVCGTQILDADEEFADSFSGTINADGTITVNWENDAGDTGTSTMTYLPNYQGGE